MGVLFEEQVEQVEQQQTTPKAIEAAESYERQCHDYYQRVLVSGQPMSREQRQLVSAHAAVVRSMVIRENRIGEAEFAQALAFVRRNRQLCGSGI